MDIVWSCIAGYGEAHGAANGAPGGTKTGTGAELAGAVAVAVLTLVDDHSAAKNREIIMQSQ